MGHHFAASTLPPSPLSASEYGEVAWHQAGARLNKRTSFNDFAAVAKALSTRGVTSPSQLAIMGGSNGGLLTLAASLREPSLYAAAVSLVPVADFVRFSKFTIGHACVSGGRQLVEG